MMKAKKDKNPKVIPIRAIAKASPIISLFPSRDLQCPADQPYHYLLPSLLTAWKENLISAEEMDDAYLDVAKATALLAR